MPYAQLVKDRILNVLGMDSTGIPMNSTAITSPLPDLLKSRGVSSEIRLSSCKRSELEPIEIRERVTIGIYRYQDISILAFFLPKSSHAVKTRRIR